MPPSSPRSSKSGAGAKSGAAAAAAAAAAPPGEERVILLTGAEAARKSAEAAALVKKFVDDTFADFDSETIDGGNATADRALANVATVPMGEGRRVVLVRDTQQMEADEQKRLAAGLARIPSSGLLILHTGTPIVEEGKTKRQSEVTTDLVNAVKKCGFGRIIEFALPKAEDLRGWLVREARGMGKTLAPDALAMLSQIPGEDLHGASMELAKVAAYVGDDTAIITGADVEATLSRGPDDVIFKLCDAVGMRRAPEALGYVSTLFRGGGRPDAVAPRALVMLARQIRLLAQFRYLGENRYVGRSASGPIPPEVMTLLPGDGAGGILTNPRMSWRANAYVAQARNFTLSELYERMEKLLAADLALKGISPGGDSPQALLQRLVVELC